MPQFRREGNTVTYTPGTAVAAGTVVQLTNLAGIANADIPANTPGDLNIKGVIEGTRSVTTGALAVGGLVGFDTSGQEFVAAGTGDFDMIVAEPTADGASAVHAFFNNGT